MTTDNPHVRHIDTSRAHPARVYDWLLGGKDNYPVDEAVGEKLPPEAHDAARQNRAFMHRAAAWLASEGVDQFLPMVSAKTRAVRRIQASWWMAVRSRRRLKSP